MAELKFPTLADIVQRIQTDVQNELPQSNPYLPNSYLRALIVGLAARYYENYQQLNSAVNDLYPNTAVDQFIDLWGQNYGIFPRQATQASGYVTSTGVIGAVIPQGTILTTSDNNSYEVQLDAGVALVNLNVTLSRTGSIVTANTGSNSHNFATNILVTISGATENEYNGTYQITVLDEFNFTYELTDIPSGTADSGIASANIASILVQSVDFGADQNIDSGDTLSYQSAVSGIDNDVAYVQITGVEGGQDADTSADMRERVLYRLANPIAEFSSSAIIAQAKLIAGVTRVWVQETIPAAGQVTIYFVRDNDPVIIPTPAEVEQVRNSILLIKPGPTDSADVIVAAPTPVDITFDFSSIEPDTETMKEAVSASLVQFFNDNAGVGDDILQLGYNSAIYNTVDPATGQKVTDFSLSSPSGNITIQSNEIGILEDVNFD